jgi:hypothetical protein
MPAPKYTAEQRENIDIVTRMTGCSKEQATTALAKNNWDPSNAILALSDYTPDTPRPSTSLSSGDVPENIAKLRAIVDERAVIYEKVLGRK